MNHEKQKVNPLEINDGQTRAISSGEIKQKTGKMPKAEREKKQKKNGKKTYISVIISFAQCILYIAFIVGISYFIATTLVKMANDVFAFKKDKDVSYTIVLGEYANVDQIAAELENNGIIEYAEVFKLYSKLRKDNGRYLTGSIELNSQMDYDTIRDKLKNKSVEVKEVRITIPEGFSCEQIIDLLVSKGIGDKEEYKRVINTYDFEFDFLPAMEAMDDDRDYRLEGYLFPDTYDFTPFESEVDVINKFLRNFKTKFEDQYYLRANKLGMSVDDIIILASIIEKEAAQKEDFGKVSAVFHNRLAQGMKLESDPTAKYTDGATNMVLTAEQVNTETPYNTYVITGLPAGPICNPSPEAINAALYPDESYIAEKYLYFCSKDPANGELHFSRTLDEHERAVAIYAPLWQAYDAERGM